VADGKWKRKMGNHFRGVDLRWEEEADAGVSSRSRASRRLTGRSVNMASGVTCAALIQHLSFAPQSLEMELEPQPYCRQDTLDFHYD